MSKTVEQDHQKIIIDDPRTGASVMAWFTNGAPQISLTVGFGERENHDIDLAYARPIGRN